MVLVRSSGCGKSTTLRILPDWKKSLVYVSIGVFVSQHPAKNRESPWFPALALYPHMTVYENLAFACAADFQER